MATTLQNSSGSLTVVIRSPFLGDTRKPHCKGLFRRARDHTLYGYKFTSSIQSLSLAFGDMNRPTVQSLVSFLKSTAGQTITLILDNGTNWSGYLLNDPFSSEHEGIKNSRFDLKFEGTLVSGTY